MALAFAKTIRAQEAERSPASVVAAAVAIALLGAWLLWFFRAHVAIYEASERARIEVAGSAHAIEAPVAGRIVSLDLVLERRVQAGDVLVVLDSTLVEQQLAEAKARYDALAPRIEARRAEIASEENLRTRDSAESGTGIAAARARLLEAEAAAALARDELARFESLFKGGTISEVQLVRARSDAAQRKASADSARLEVARLGRQGETSSSESVGPTRGCACRREASSACWATRRVSSANARPIGVERKTPTSPPTSTALAAWTPKPDGSACWWRAAGWSSASSDSSPRS